jgi:hypothetical protein
MFYRKFPAINCRAIIAASFQDGSEAGFGSSASRGMPEMKQAGAYNIAQDEVVSLPEIETFHFVSFSTSWEREDIG